MTKKALVIVLGDLARSPRMQYHCMSLAKSEYFVTVIANGGGPSSDRACDSLESNNNIRQQLMNDRTGFKSFLPQKLAFIIKPIWQALLLIIQLFIAPSPDVIIVQNPPSIPTLPILYIYSRLIRSRLIIDWHNYGFSILSLSQGPNSLFVRLMKSIEVSFGRLADAGFCVSQVMQKDLRNNFKIDYPLVVLYDKPPLHFRPLSLRKKHQFLIKIKNQISEFRSYDDTNQNETRFTEAEADNISYRTDRPAILFSSTSWTEDEDFDMLLESLALYDSYAGEYLPEVLCVITGKGPLKSFYEEEIKRRKLNRVKFVLPWLSAEDYAAMVACSDLGISLHKSSSGVDLPMKVVDLFGCGIPVLAYKYEAINELVIEDFYGQTFNHEVDLFEKLVLLLDHFRCDDETNPIEQYKKNIKRHFLKSRWESNWVQVAKPLIDGLAKTLHKTK